MSVRTFRKRPVVVEAVQFTDDNVDEVKAFVGDEDMFVASTGALMVPAGEALMEVTPGGWFVRAADGGVDIYAPDEFEQLHEPVGDHRG